MKTQAHRGKYSKADVLAAISKTRITVANHQAVIDFLCNGVKLGKLGISKQHAHPRISRVIGILQGQHHKARVEITQEEIDALLKECYGAT